MSHSTNPEVNSVKYGFAGKLALMFIESKLTPLAVAASLLLGVFAVLMLPHWALSINNSSGFISAAAWMPLSQPTRSASCIGVSYVSFGT